MNIFDLNDLDESHATNPLRTWMNMPATGAMLSGSFLFQFVASDAGVCSQCLKIGVDLM